MKKIVIAAALFALAPCAANAQVGMALGAGVDQMNRMRELDMQRQQIEMQRQAFEHQVRMEEEQRKYEERRRAEQARQAEVARQAEARRCEELHSFARRHEFSDNIHEKYAGQRLTAFLQSYGGCPGVGMDQMREFAGIAIARSQEVSAIIDKAVSFKQKRMAFYKNKDAAHHFDSMIAEMLSSGGKLADADQAIAKAHSLTQERFDKKSQKKGAKS